jgi:Amt family ammonium transporter
MVTIVYFPIAHMVWYWAGPDFLPDAPTDYGPDVGLGRARFCRRHRCPHQCGYRRPCRLPHDRQAHRLGKEADTAALADMTMIGASLLWVGWFGFNAGSNLEANGVTAVAFINTFVATAAAAVSLGALDRAGPARQAHRCWARSLARLPGWSPSRRPRASLIPMTSILLGFAVFADLLLLRLQGEEQVQI